MSLGRWSADKIYLYRDPVDMRKGANGLALIVKDQMNLDPTDAILFVFLNKKRDKIKLLIWEVNGFWVLQKNLLQQKYKWPKWFDAANLGLPESALLQLLDGLDLNGLQPHKQLFLKHFA